MAVGPRDRRRLGRTGLEVSPACIGTSPLASMPEHYGYEVDERRAAATIGAALRGPFNFIDTSNNYGAGAAERYIGSVLAAAGGLPPGFVLATKVDADPDTGDFSGERVKRSVEESLGRLGLDRVQLMYLHDPELHLSFDEAMAPGGAIILMSSMASQRANGRNPAYESSKAAQIALGRAIARAGEEKGVRCNVIAPGFMDTPMGRDASRRRADRAVTVPFGRQGTGWEVAYTALFLISNESSYINAQTMFLDGGHLAGIVRA